MHSYRCYGLAFRSAIPLPAPAELISDADVEVHIERNTAFGDQRQFLSVGPEESVLSLTEIGVFQVRGGREVIVRPRPSTTDCALQPFLAGTVMSMVLHQRGFLPLHASSVVIGGAAVCFVAEKGWGKSSIAAALHARNHPILSDDVTAVHTDGEPNVVPGLPLLKLVPDIAHALSFSGRALPVMAGFAPKLACAVTAGASSGSVPLRAVYLLSRGEGEDMTPVHRGEVFLELVRHSFPTRMLRAGDADHFRSCAALARLVPGFRLRGFRTLEELPRIASKVEEHVRDVVPQHHARMSCASSMAMGASS